jgi:hypothetical protein
MFAAPTLEVLRVTTGPILLYTQEPTAARTCDQTR